MFSVSFTIAVRIVIRFGIAGFGKQAAIIAFLQFYRVRPALLGYLKHFPGCLEFALMVMPDLGNHIAITVILDDFTVQC